jgi:preprotein translocase subunit SecA
MPEEVDPATWDMKSLADWGNTNFNAGVKGSDLRKMKRREVADTLQEAADRTIDAADLAPLDQFIVQHYGEKELAKWATNKFGGEFTAEEFVGVEDLQNAVTTVMQRARATYARREITYPVEFAMDMTAAGLGQNPQQALNQFCNWARARYELEWTPEALPSPDPNELKKLLIEEAERWDDARIAARADKAVAAATTPDELDAWFQANVGAALTDEEKARAAEDPRGVAVDKITEALRAELTQFERWVLLQIVDQAWKDHLYAIDQLKESIGLRSFSQRDPRIEFKREGARLFEEMHESVRDKVTDLIFKAKLSPQVQQRRPAPQAQPAGGGEGGAPAPAPAQRRRPVAPAQPAIAAAAAAASGTASQRADIEAAERAGTGGQPERKKRQPARAVPTVGRNEPCPCGSGKKFKQCCGKRG